MNALAKRLRAREWAAAVAALAAAEDDDGGGAGVEIDRDGAAAAVYLLAHAGAQLGLLAWPDEGRRGEPVPLGSLTAHAVADWEPVAAGASLPAVVREGRAALARRAAEDPGSGDPGSGPGEL